jgi:hypothetical protein
MFSRAFERLRSLLAGPSRRREKYPRAVSIEKTERRRLEKLAKRRERRLQG